MSEQNDTPSSALAKYFEFKVREAALYALWEQHQVFKPETAADQTAPVFNISMPPPNANGELHIGHSFGYTVMDILGRFHRALGERVLLLPGKDHAGIQTQVVYEKKLRKEGVEPSSIPTDQLYQRCYDFCIDRAGYMRSQEKRLGLSADWSRELFTLDPRLSSIVFETFKRMWDDGLVYRGTRIVNWSVFSQTAISDVEVEYKEAEGGLWYLCYPFNGARQLPQFPEVPLPSEIVSRPGSSRELVLIGSSDAMRQLTPGAAVTIGEQRYVVFATAPFDPKELPGQELTRREREQIETLSATGDLTTVRVLPYAFDARGLVTATTRPETMLGDTALAVHPEDPRYRELIGAEVVVPLVDRVVKVIADVRVDPAYGTGVIKVTPAHDFLDYDIGQDHELEIIQVIGKDGRMTEAAGAGFAGLSADECRKKVVATLDERGLLLETTTIMHKVPIGERGKDVIEPLISEQWFVAVDKPGNSLKQRALELVRSGQINIYPERFRVLFEQWLENLRDWNISRQIWWGHRLPVWYREAANGLETYVGVEAPTGDGWQQDTDTFDTWFSSGQWAFSTVTAQGLSTLDGETPSAYFPTHTMVMGRDILFFWACRMLLLTVYRTGTIPWRNIFFTGLIRDEHGQKMSKSKGNGVEPNDIIERFGTDALRLALVMGASAGNDISFGEKKVEGYSKFINKLWNAAKLLEMKLGNLPALPDGYQNPQKLASTRWILSQLATVQATVRTRFERFELSVAADELYGFTWQTFCDWYLESMKILVERGAPDEVQEVQATALEAFRSLLAMLHPITPFITEEIYQQLPMLQVKAAPTLAQLVWRPITAHADQGQMQVVLEAVSAVRSVKAALNVPHKRINIATDRELDAEQRLLLSELARADLVGMDAIDPALALRKPLTQGVVVCEVEGKELYRQRIEKDLTTQRALIAQLEKKLSGAFATQAKPEVVEKERERLASAQHQVAELEREQRELAG